MCIRDSINAEYGGSGQQPMSSLPESPTRGVVAGSDKWQPDEEVDACYACGTSFGLLTRRHHCRSCGHIFCSDCCEKRRTLDLYPNGKQRVCNDCDLQIAHFEDKMRSLRLDSDLQRIQEDHLVRMRQSQTVDHWCPKIDESELLFDEKGFRLPEGVTRDKLDEVRAIEAADQQVVIQQWSDFLSPLVRCVISKGDKQEPLGLRFKEEGVGSSMKKQVKIDEVLSSGLCARTGCVLVKGDVVLVVNGHTTWTEMISAIRNSHTVEILVAAEGARSSKQRTALDMCCLTYAADGRREENLNMFHEAFVSTIANARGCTDKKNKLSREEQVVSMFRAGVPPDMRSTIYLFCCYKLHLMSNNLYAEKVASAHASPEEGGLDDMTVGQIEKDLPRTMSDQNIRALTDEGIESLSRILKAFAVQDSAVGYCQGMNMLAAFLFSFFEEEQVFWILSSLVSHIVPGYFVKSMIGITTDMNTAAIMVQTYMPSLYSHLEQVMPVQILSQNYLQLCFVGTLPCMTTLRILDLLMLTCIVETVRPITVLCAAFLALMERCETAMLEDDEINPEEVVNLIKYTAESQLNSVDFMRSVCEWIDKIDVNELERIWMQERNMQLSTAKSTLHDQFNPMAQDAGFSSDDFESLYEDFLACARAEGNREVLDRVCLKRVEFKRLCANQLGDRGDYAFDVLFDLFDSDRNGTIDMLECVNGLAALSSKTSPVHTLEWLFAVFSSDSQKELLQKEDLTRMLQFISIMAGIQMRHHHIAGADRIVQTQRWWAMFRWSETGTSGISADPPGFTDCSERALPIATDNEIPTTRAGVPISRLGWVPVVSEHTDKEGWVYAFSFPAIQERLVTSNFKKKDGINKIARWRLYSNKFAEQICGIAQAQRGGGHQAVNCKEFVEILSNPCDGLDFSGLIDFLY
eukprot:TRINITY_DN20973_c0_g1_i1.p1 TRINITY_DN20973_c0_g1~~TRINITY_DN20973_c0_g1_i1.p1  ORF type:complete len:917 (+),score=229.42 TRINITY_DN20973_c0_g1_i1:173-2923(+)